MEPGERHCREKVTCQVTRTRELSEKKKPGRSLGLKQIQRKKKKKKKDTLGGNNNLPASAALGETTTCRGNGKHKDGTVAAGGGRKSPELPGKEEKKKKNTGKGSDAPRGGSLRDPLPCSIKEDKKDTEDSRGWHNFPKD